MFYNGRHYSSEKDFIMQSKKKKIILEILVFVSLVLIMCIWYPNNNWKVIMGDDLIAVTGFKDRGFIGTLLNPENAQMGKVRPVSTIILYIVYKICNLSYAKYFLINRIVLIIVAYLIYYLSQKMDINKLFAFLIAILVITTPFSSYGVWQMIGICESFSLLCCVLCLYYISRLILCENQKYIKKSIFWCTIWFALLIFNAERFMYLIAVFLFVVILCNKLNIKEKICGIITLCMPIIVRTIIIGIAGGDSLNTGRGEATSLVGSLISYAIQGLINVFGFSIGQEWHGGYNYYSLPSYILLVGCFIALFSIGILYRSLEVWIKEKCNDSYVIVVMYMFSLSSLFSYALVASTHGEDRFLWVSYIYLCIAIMRYFSINIQQNRSKYFVLIGVIIVFVLNGYYVKNKIHVHYRYSQEMAQTCIDSINKLEGKNEIQNICCVKPSDYSWVFYGGVFFQYYVDENINVYFYDDFESIDYDKLGDKTVVVYPDENYAIPYGTTACWISDLK